MSIDFVTSKVQKVLWDLELRFEKVRKYKKYFPIPISCVETKNFLQKLFYSNQYCSFLGKNYSMRPIQVGVPEKSKMEIILLLLGYWPYIRYCDKTVMSSRK